MLRLILNNKLGLLVSQGSAATYFRCGGQCYTGFVAIFILFLPVTNFEQWLNFGHVCFLDTV